jgi:cytochrome P450
VEAEREGRVRSEAEAIATLILLLVAGNETTTNFLGNAVLALLRHPDQLQRLREDPTLTERAVEELLRYDPPAQTTTRVALQEVEIGGRRIEPNQVVFAVLGAANRDPQVFPEPDRLDLARHPNPHLAFGEGIHFCLGASLARAESQIALRALLDRFPHLRLVEEEPCWRPNYILRGLKRLLVSPSTTGRTWA